MKDRDIENMTVSELKNFINECYLKEFLVKTESQQLNNRGTFRGKAEFELQKRLNFKKKIIGDLLEEEGISFEHLNESELSDLKGAWMNRFNGEALSKSEYAKYDYQLWLVFHPDYYSEYVEGENADQKYGNQQVKEYLIWGGGLGYKCFSNKLPDLNRLKELTRGKLGVVYDIYVSHKNFKWTYVFTHNDYSGPYFAE